MSGTSSQIAKRNGQRGLRKQELANLAKYAGTSHCLVGKVFEPEDVVVEGRVSVSKLRAGLVMHAAETSEVHDLTMEMVLQPCLNVFFILDGGVEFTLDGRPYTFSALKDDGHTHPTAYAIAIAKPTRLVRHSRRGARTRKVNIQIQPQWLKDCGIDRKDKAKPVGCFLKQHRAYKSWKPSARTVALAEQILNPPILQPIVKDLYLESRAIELAAEALQALSGDLQCPAMAGAATGDVGRAQAIRTYLEDHLGENLTLPAIAGEAGMGVSTLQRLFKDVYGKTVVEFVRQRKLENAREAIEKKGLTVSEAAYLAGYNNPANFATAFKREFGLSPKLLRK